MTEQTETEAFDDTQPGLPGCVVLVRKPGDNQYYGYTENSWSMGYEPDCVRFWWTGTGTDNFFGKQWNVDGRKDAERHVEEITKNHPDWEVKVFDVDDPELPITIDWPLWHKQRNGEAPAPKGAKYADRNPAFQMKD